MIEAQARHGVVEWPKAVVAWAEHAKGQIARATMTRYLQSLALCEPLIGGRMVGEIDGSIIRGLVAARRHLVGIATVRRDLTAVSRVLAYAQAAGWREGDPALDDIRLLRERRDPIVLPDEESIQAVFGACSPALRNLAVAAGLTGARQAELTALKWSQFNAEAGTLEILKGKGNRRRVVKLSPAALEHISGLARKGELISPCADGPGSRSRQRSLRRWKKRRRASPSASMTFAICTPARRCGAGTDLSRIAALRTYERQDDRDIPCPLDP